jgi:hypothetical protein
MLFWPRLTEPIKDPFDPARGGVILMANALGKIHAGIALRIVWRAAGVQKGISTQEVYRG